MPINRKTIDAALKHLRASDPILGRVISQVGPFTLRPQRDRFGMLVRSIISQQISTAAARSIRRRLQELLAPEPIAPASLGAIPTETLRTVGLSAQKTAYLHDLCAHVLDGRIELARIGRKSDEEVIATLISVHGIGRWTAQMFLMFALGRLDVLPHADLGVRTAIRNLYGLDELPNRTVCEEIAEPWRPYASVASWYCWRSEDLRREAKSRGDSARPTPHTPGSRGYPV